MKKILFVLNSLTFGGAERQTVTLINHLDPARFDVGLLYLERNESLLSSLNRDRLSVCECLDKKSKFDMAVLLKCHRHISSGTYDLVVCVNAYAMIYMSLCRLSTKNPFKLAVICQIGRAHV